jgi:two-component system chemotaxis sensor kinase CheA
MNDIVNEFLVESRENLDLLDRELVHLERDPANREMLASIFRTIHTIKGTCGFLSFSKLEAVAHVGENLLSRMRDGELSLTAEITTALLTMVDAIRQMLASIEANGNEGERHDEELIATLTRLQHGDIPHTSSPSPEPTAILNARPAPAKSTKAGTAKRKTKTAAEKSHANLKPPPPSASTLIEEDSYPQSEILADRDVEPVGEAPDGLLSQQTGRPLEGETTIRVGVGLLDRLMNLVGELVLARNQVLQFTHRAQDNSFLDTTQRLNLITSELQESVMKTRMQPIGNIWSKFPRTVRDVAVTCGKKVSIQMEGKETELDKTIIEAIKDPLMHLVRNAVDHGIEVPEQRIAAGKPMEGRLSLRAFHEGGQVIIEISDDGGGLNCEVLRRKAVDKGLITAEQASKLGEREAANLIFLPGFSTAAKVTNVSGRGVGMDVVKTNIEKIGGSVDVSSVLGAGTTVKMKIPLTLAIVPGLIVLSAGRRFVIPQVSLLELVSVDGEQARNRIEMVHGVPVYRLRGRLLPLVYLDRLLQLSRNSKTSDQNDNAVNIVVLQAENRHFGLIVDEIRDTEEIVVKPLGRSLKSVKTFAGATIMGDGKVALILDVLGLAQRAGTVGKQEDRALAAALTEVPEQIEEKHTFLIFAGPDDSRMALPLDRLARLEEFPASQVEKSGEQWVIQYRDQILPLIRLRDVMEERRARVRHVETLETPPDALLQVLVCTHNEHTVGLVVENILDIVEDRAEVQSPAARSGVLYSAVIKNRVTELLDLPAIIRAGTFSIERSENLAGVSN